MVGTARARRVNASDRGLRPDGTEVLGKAWKHDDKRIYTRVAAR